MSKRPRNQVNDAQRANRLDIQPRTENQRKFLNLLKTQEQVLATGSAGTGKTFLATVIACEMLLRGKVEKIVLTRPAVAACGEEYGFLPGGINQKLGPWVQPVMEVIEDCLGKQQTMDYMKTGVIEIAPLGFLRGRTFRNAFVLVDEAQNTTPEQMQLILTRIGEGSRLVISGDLQQSDIGRSSGLSIAFHLATKYQIPVGLVHFTSEDVVRSDLCKKWVMAFENG